MEVSRGRLLKDGEKRTFVSREVAAERDSDTQQLQGPLLKGTRTNNQLQILFSQHLSASNYPQKLHKEHHYQPLAHAHVCSACLLKRDSLAGWLFTRSQLNAIVVRTVATSHQYEAFSAFFSQCEASKHPRPPQKPNQKASS